MKSIVAVISLLVMGLTLFAIGDEHSQPQFRALLIQDFSVPSTVSDGPVGKKYLILEATGGEGRFAQPVRSDPSQFTWRETSSSRSAEYVPIAEDEDAPDEVTIRHGDEAVVVKVVSVERVKTERK